MKVIVVSNCATSTYYEVVLTLFPDWTIKAAGFNEAERWIETGEKPEFENYLKECDLYIGWPLDGLRLANVLNPSAERVIIPELYFRGLHPDVAMLDGFWGPFSEGAPHTQTSLIALGAKAIGKTAEETQVLFREDVYEKLGYFDLYKTERSRLVADFGKYGIRLEEAFDFWETQNDFFYVCHHPRSFVLVDIVRNALAGRFLDADAYARSESIRRTQPDKLSAGTEIWPVYPEIARRFGFEGSLTWSRFPNCSPREMSLSRVIDIIFESLGRMDDAWKSVPFIAECAKTLERV
ncbi:hypothetical protein A1351_15420 [Methylosinus sp. R-45379]|uniref:WcbI family polysaccharide biosynthesis putative acetyltransferase n=1 Tax=unclassified Methylosinus TaxID=2624500 RepID=UPI0004662576|nr:MULTISPECIES: WcbI family polysaccharide biosynthesis putative acetyltransferase [unclassified Methylosinus]OAI26171.1 hypothetical protein A1351_15420 [Methylosinus sp. R-45379]